MNIPPARYPTRTTPADFGSLFTAANNGPVFLLKPFGFHLTMDTLSSGCLRTEFKLRYPLGCLLRFRLCARLGSPYSPSPASEALPPLLDMIPLIRVPEGL